MYETCKGVVEPATAHTWDKGKCSVCGYECTHEGEDTEWVITPDTHEKVYKTCREVVEPATAHTGGEASCTKKAVCETCHVEYGPLKPHTLKHEDAKAATLTTYGNKEYWFCNVCGKYFGDENATNEVKLSDIVIAKLAPTIIAGDGQTVVVSGKTALTFTSNAAFEDFIRVELDGKTVDSNNYTVASGSTVVKLNADYVATLAAGDHILGIVSQGGTATAKFTVTKKATESTTTTVKAETTGTTTSAKTGDNSNLGLWITLLCVSGGAVTATTIVNRRKKCNR